MEAVTFTAAVARVQTLADGGLRFTFDAPESAVMEAAELMTYKRFGVVLRVTCERYEQGDQEADAVDAVYDG